MASPTTFNIQYDITDPRNLSFLQHPQSLSPSEERVEIHLLMVYQLPSITQAEGAVDLGALLCTAAQKYSVQHFFFPHLGCCR